MCRCGCGRTNIDLHWARFSEADTDLHRLQLACSAAARSYVEAARSFARAQKTDALLGAGAGQRELAHAEAHRVSLARSARQARQLLQGVAEALEPARRAEIDDFLSSGGLPPIGAAARTHALARLIDSDIPVASASAAISQLDEVLAGLGQLRTADDAIAGIDARLAQLADNSRADFDAAAQNPWCLVQLILSSLFATMLLVFTILCLLALCDPVTVFEQWVQQVCGVT